MRCNGFGQKRIENGFKDGFKDLEFDDFCTDFV